MFNAGDCSSCHATPKQKDRTRLGGGRALKTPFGTFYPPNISSDAKDGIGGWSEAQFVTAMHDGVCPGGAHLYPAFPYTSYIHMTFADLRDLFAYLKTLPAVQGRAPAHELSFPFTVRRGIGLWKRAVFRSQHLQARSVEIGRMESRRLSRQWARPLRRVPQPAQHVRRHHQRVSVSPAAPIRKAMAGCPTSRRRALPTGRSKDIAYLLESGMMPDGDVVGSSMKRWWTTPRCSAPPTAWRWRPTSSRCRRWTVRQAEEMSYRAPPARSASLLLCRRDRNCCAASAFRCRCGCGC